jgi:hypothetical protein
VKNKLDTTQKKVAVAYIGALLLTFPGRTEDTHKNTNQYNEFMGRDMNSAASE